MNFRENEKRKKAEAEIRKYINLFRKSCKSIDTDAFFKENSHYITNALLSRDAIYILNIATMQYVFLNDKFAFITQYDNSKFIIDGWKYLETLVLEEDKLAVCVTLKEFYRLIKTLKPAKRKQAVGEISYRLENKNGEEHKILQTFQIIALDRKGAPAVEIGTLKVITHHKKDNAVMGTIEVDTIIAPIEPIKLSAKLKPYTLNQSLIASYVEDGLSNTEIELKTGIKENDIENIRRGIIKKEKAKNMTHAIYKKNKRGA